MRINQTAAPPVKTLKPSSADRAGALLNASTKADAIIPAYASAPSSATGTRPTRDQRLDETASQPDPAPHPGSRRPAPRASSSALAASARALRTAMEMSD